MFEMISQNLGTIVVGLIVAACIVLAIRSVRKNGIDQCSECNGSCTDPSACHASADMVKRLADLDKQLPKNV